jgi:hypothetical protein
MVGLLQTFTCPFPFVNFFCILFLSRFYSTTLLGNRVHDIHLVTIIGIIFQEYFGCGSWILISYDVSGMDV